MHYFQLTAGKNIYTCLSIDEARNLQQRIGGIIEHQFSN
jgi:hypothetical protein